MLPSATEIVYALGLDDDLVGVTFECNQPPRARLEGCTRTSPLCCQVVGEAVCSCAGECGPVLAGVKVGPARARGADPGGAPPGPRLRAGWFGAYQEQAEV